MSRARAALDKAAVATEKQVEAEVEKMDFRPDHIDADTWSLIQENGRIATERLSDLLNSPRFHRFKISDQAKLITLAQNRAFGMPLSHKAETGGRNSARFKDVTAATLRGLVDRAKLPEYTGTELTVEVNDEEEL